MLYSKCNTSDIFQIGFCSLGRKTSFQFALKLYLKSFMRLREKITYPNKWRASYLPCAVGPALCISDYRNLPSFSDYTDPVVQETLLTRKMGKFIKGYCPCRFYSNCISIFHMSVREQEVNGPSLGDRLIFSDSAVLWPLWVWQNEPFLAWHD